MTPKQAHIMLTWYCMRSLNYDVHYPEDLDTIETLLLPMFKDNHDHINGTEDSHTFHEQYVQWTFNHLPKLRKEIEGYIE